MLSERDLKANLKKIVAQIKLAATQAGRNPEDIKLIAVSKFQPPEAIAGLWQAGQRDFGENYVQEATKKQSALADLDINWHFIGNLQTNKAKKLVGEFCLIHTLSSLKMAQALHKIALKKKCIQAVLVQVNLAHEPNKGGILPEDVPAFVEQLLEISSLDLQGLMCMPPVQAVGEAARPYFGQLRTLKEELEKKFTLSLPELSMGMSADFQEAIREGATLVRIGTQIFGPREQTLS